MFSEGTPISQTCFRPSGDGLTQNPLLFVSSLLQFVTLLLPLNVGAKLSNIE
jgi:hypothetical protein